MGCGCKQARAESSKIQVLRHEDAIQIIDPEPITYTQQDINRARAYLLMSGHPPMEKEWFISFVSHYLKETIQGYCDQICKKRINERLDKLQQKLT